VAGTVRERCVAGSLEHRQGESFDLSIFTDDALSHDLGRADCVRFSLLALDRRSRRRICLHKNSVTSPAARPAPALLLQISGRLKQKCEPRGWLGDPAEAMAELGRVLSTRSFAGNLLAGGSARDRFPHISSLSAAAQTCASQTECGSSPTLRQTCEIPST